MSYPYNRDYRGNYHTPQYNSYQMQQQINKQKVSLIQDQKSSNTIMCRILSELENLAISLSYQGPRYFGYYATIPNNHQDIINQIVLQMRIFESSYKNFVKTNPGRQYIFPNNLQYTNIVDIVNGWIAYLTKRSKETRQQMYENALKYYYEFLNILANGNLSYSFKNEFENLGRNEPPISQNELRRVMNAGSSAVVYMNEDHDDIEQQVAKHGDYKVNAVLMGDRKDNKFYNNMDKYDARINNYKKELDSYLYPMLGYLEKYAIMNKISNKIIHPKYNSYIKPNINDENQVINQYSLYFNKLYDHYNMHMSDKIDYDLEPKELQQFINDITNWKNSTTNMEVKKEANNAISLLKKAYDSNK